MIASSTLEYTDLSQRILAKEFQPLDDFVVGITSDQQAEIAEFLYQFGKRNHVSKELVEWEIQREIEHTST
jgi:hypothetical protein